MRMMILLVVFSLVACGSDTGASGVNSKPGSGDHTEDSCRTIADEECEAKDGCVLSVVSGGLRTCVPVSTCRQVESPTWVETADGSKCGRVDSTCIDPELVIVETCAIETKCELFGPTDCDEHPDCYAKWGDRTTPEEISPNVVDRDAS